MTYSPLAIKRRQVLGPLYPICDNLETVPVRLENADGEELGYADESLGLYADAYLFHLPEDVCKKLSTGHYIYSFDYEVLCDEGDESHKHICIHCIYLTGRKAPDAVSRTSKRSLLA